MKSKAAADALAKESSLREYAGVIRRRKLVVLQAILIVPLVMVLIALRETPLYEASASVLVNLQNPVQAITGTSDPSASANPDRTLQTQSQLAANPLVATRVLREAGIRESPLDFLTRSSVQAQLNSDLLVFTVSDTNAKRAVKLATLYGKQFTIYRRQLDTVVLSRADAELKKRLSTLVAAHQQNTADYQTLVDQEQKLATAVTLQTSNVSLVKTPLVATKIRPNPKKSALTGLALGIVLGIGLAFLFEAFDTRILTAEDVERELGLPLLARIPAPARWLQNKKRLVMLAEPHTLDAEPYRVLRTNLEFFNAEHNAQVILVTSAVRQEGKSTTVANLAVALSLAGRRVVLVDVDLRRPTIAGFFGNRNEFGLTDVALGRAGLSSPMVGTHTGDNDQLDPGRTAGTLEVMTTGRLPSDAGEFVSSAAVGKVIDELRSRADIVLLDAPPILAFSDALALAARSDGVIVLTRLGVVKRKMLEELRRVLSSIPAAKIGVVVTGAELDPETTYGYGYGYGYGSEQETAERPASTRERRRR
ncbi:MAG: tyrosine-protein kinase domain-containing protein [Gaiellaceae bacterium]